MRCLGALALILLACTKVNAGSFENYAFAFGGNGLVFSYSYRSGLGYAANSCLGFGCYGYGAVPQVWVPTPYGVAPIPPSTYSAIIENQRYGTIDAGPRRNWR